MTDRVSAFIVILDDDIRDDDAEVTLNAIKQIKGVLQVKPYIADPAISIAEERIRADLSVKLWQVLYPNLKDNKQ